MPPATAPTSISDERAIANLMVEYAYRNDEFDVAGLGELFAESAFTLDGRPFAATMRSCRWRVG